MELYPGHVLVAELAQMINTAPSLFYVLKTVEVKKIGGTAVLEIASLPAKYRRPAKDCVDLGEYYPAKELSRQIGCSDHYFYAIKDDIRRGVISKKVAGKRLIELPKRFVEYLNSGYKPFAITKNADLKLADEIINFYGLRVGLYK